VHGCDAANADGGVIRCRLLLFSFGHGGTALMATRGNNENINWNGSCRHSHLHTQTLCHDVNEIADVSRLTGFVE